MATKASTGRCAVIVACATASALSVTSAIAGDTLYSFTDEAGVTHISNVPADERYRPERGGESPRVVSAVRDVAIQPLAPTPLPIEEEPLPAPRQPSDR